MYGCFGGALCPWRPGEVEIRFLGSGVEPPCRSGESRLTLLEGQQVLVTPQPLLSDSSCCGYSIVVFSLTCHVEVRGQADGVGYAASTMRILRIKLRLLGLASDVFTHITSLSFKM